MNDNKVPGWNNLIIGTRKRSPWPAFVPGQKKLEEIISDLKKKNNNVGVKIHQSALNVVSRADKKVKQTNNTNDVRAYRLYGENLVRGISYLIKYEDPKRITVMKCIKKGAALKEEQKKNS